MPSFLGSYRNSASNLESKIERAINSVLAQSFEDWELVVIADGCEKTEIIVKPYVYEYLPKVRLLQIPKQKTWSGAVRNAGIFNAKGEIIIYLDVDDYWGTDHLKIVNDNFKKNDWVIFNDWIYNK
ncbi:MAG: glycosyltransferase family A protein, partial [Sediminibacterium sp.]